MSHSNNLRYEFGPFQLDPDKRILTHEGETIPLTPKATDVLIVLVTRAGQLLDKDELLKEIWPDTFVEEANLTQHIFTLRRALYDDRSDPKYIETIARRGYRFIAAVRILGSDDADSSGITEAALQPVVAVLPFSNSTGETELDYLADGLTENIINNLSRVPKLRVMSQSAAFRYKTKDIDPQQVGKELRAHGVLVGNIHTRRMGFAISVELVDAATGWQLWGESYDSQSKDLLQIQDAITRQVLTALKLRLTGEEEKHITARYTENGEAYQAYLQGRYHWSRYTRKGIEKAIKHFRRAIDLDRNYALAYAAIVDCYLRLATNYLPPDDHVARSANETSYPSDTTSASLNESDPRLRLRFEWDWRGAEREIRRAHELKTDYPAAHQWYAAYKTAQRLFKESHTHTSAKSQSKWRVNHHHPLEPLPSAIASLQLTPSEEVQVFCAIAREQIDCGNSEAACQILRPWWSFGNRPTLQGLSQQCCADLLFTAGELASYVANTKQLPRGQKHSEELLNGSIALFEQLELRARAAEGRIELGLCYYRQGLFDIAQSTLIRVLDDLTEESIELRSLALIRLATLERHAGRLKDALERLGQAEPMVVAAGPWVTGRYYLELASINKDLAVSETGIRYFDDAKCFYMKALSELEAVGHHRYVAVVENNLGFLLLGVGSYEESERHLLRSLKAFNSFGDIVAAAQVNETLARLYIETRQHDLARESIQRAVNTLERTDGEALLAEALTTYGVVAARQGRYRDAKKSFEAAYNISERCGDHEGAGRALLMMYEELAENLDPVEKREVAGQLKKVLTVTQQNALQVRVEKLLRTIRPSSNAEE